MCYSESGVSVDHTTQDPGDKVKDFERNQIISFREINMETVDDEAEEVSDACPNWLWIAGQAIAQQAINTIQ